MTTFFPQTHMLNARMLDAALKGTRDNCRDADCSTNLTPRADVLESEKEFRIVMDLPGVQNDGLEINLENQALTVKATRAVAVPEGFDMRRHERSGDVQFSRSFKLGTAVDGDQISANLDSGVLQINLPKSDASLRRRIEVK